MPDGASIGADPSNACVWVATIFGRAETLWDGGMFQVELVFPPDFPDAPPFVHFLTPIFHPQVSPQGVPYMRSLVMWHHVEPKGKTVSALLQQLVTLLSVEPSPEPVTHLNVEVGGPPRAAPARAHTLPRRDACAHSMGCAAHHATLVAGGDLALLARRRREEIVQAAN